MTASRPRPLPLFSFAIGIWQGCMNRILNDLRIIEGTAFVAALAQLGADVIRFDPIRGGLDAKRWPVDQHGKSLYWVGLNKGKRSIAVDTRKPEGVT